jgi:serine/threonine protein kinase
MNKQTPNEMVKIIDNYLYEISKYLGEGAFGKVYVGFSNLNQQRVAIKKLDLQQI